MTKYKFSDSDIEMLRRIAARERRQNPKVGKRDHVPPRMISNQIVKIGKADAAITFDSSGTVSIWKRNGSGTLVDTTENVTAHLDWMHGDENVSSGKEVLVAWFQDEGIWRIIGAECE